MRCETEGTEEYSVGGAVEFGGKGGGGSVPARQVQRLAGLRPTAFSYRMDK